MSNHLKSIEAGELFERLARSCTLADAEFLAITPSTLAFSADNPLLALRLLAIDPDEGMSFTGEAMSNALNIPANWLNDEFLDAPIDEVLPALGRVALVMLAALRNTAQCCVFEMEAREDCLAAVDTLTERLEMNRKFKRCN